MKTFYLLSCIILTGGLLWSQNIGDLRSCQSGDWASAATWQKWTGTVWTAAISTDIPQTVTTKTITIKSPHVVNYAYGGRYAYDLIIESGGILKENSYGSSGKSLFISHNLICDGILGNENPAERIVLSFIGSNCTISGNGLIDCYQLRSSTFTGNVNLDICNNVFVRGAGTVVYNNNSNYLFNIHLFTGCSLNCMGEGSNTGDFNLDNTPGSPVEYGGNLIVDGNLIISGIFYASSNNSVNGCSYTINSGGGISCKGINMSASGSAGTILNINSGGTFSITGADASSVFSSTNNTYNLNGIFEYASSGAQTIKAFEYADLKLSGNGTKTIEASGTVSIKENGTLELSGSAVPMLALGSGTLSVNSSGTTLIYSASVSQNTDVEWNHSFENLILNKANTLTINSSKVFTGAIVLLSGKVVLGDYNLQAKNLYGGSQSSYIVENGTGKVKASVGASDVLFPIGESITSYTPITLNNTGGTADQYTVSCITSTAGTNNNTGVVNKQWTISEDNSGGSNLILTFQWNGVDEISPFNRLDASAAFKENNTFITMSSSDVSGTEPYVISSTVPFTQQMTSGKIFTVGNPSALPIELGSFCCSTTRGLVNLEWVTITESNCYGFNIQRKEKSKEWEDIGFVKAYGSSNSPKRYTWKEKVLRGRYSYRLKIIDTDSNYEYSNIVEANINVPVSFQLFQNYPNPFNPSTKIRYSVPEGVHRVKVAVYNLLGDELVTLLDEIKEGGEYEINFEPKQLSSGIYLYRLISENISFTKKLILIK